MKKQVVLCTYPSIYSIIVLKTLLRSDDIDIVGIVCSSRIFSPHENSLMASLRMIKQSGLRYALYHFAITDMAMLFGHVLGQSVSSLAKRYNIPMLTTKDINHQESQAFLHNIKPDLLLACHFNQKIKPAVLALPKQGCINIHPSLLPLYQGVDPVFYMLLRDERRAGVTLHKMNEVFDEGEALSYYQYTVPAESSSLTLSCALFQAGADLFCDYVSREKPIQTGSRDTAINVNVAGDLLSTHQQAFYDSWPSITLVTLFFTQNKRLYRWAEWVKCLFHLPLK